LKIIKFLPAAQCPAINAGLFYNWQPPFFHAVISLGRLTCFVQLYYGHLIPVSSLNKNDNMIKRLSAILLLTLIPSTYGSESQPIKQQPTAPPKKSINKDNDILVITASRQHTKHHQLIGNTSLIDGETISDINAQHLNQTLSYASGVWLSRGNGQESLLALRSPVLTGAGSCAEFLTLENGIPLRASGFCNVNQLFDTHFELAERIEVVKGSNSARYGSNAIHGTINVITPSTPPSPQITLDLGSYEYYRLNMQIPDRSNNPKLFAATVTSDGGFQYSSGYKQQKISFISESHIGDWHGEHSATFTHLNQETAGYLQRGENAYKDKSLLKINDFENAYRNNKAFRYAFALELNNGNTKSRVTPYLRWNRMDFLMHFLPGTPVETNGHQSLGVQWQQIHTINHSFKLNWGLDAEVTKGFLTQTQSTPTESNSAFLREVLPQGKHYDYKVNASNVALYGEFNWNLTESQHAFSALRLDHITYDYDNRMLDGNTRDDGSTCGFGGCRYTRPADRNDHFNNPSFALGWSLLMDDGQRVFVKFDRSFRAPHTSELYRLQNGQEIADIKSVKARQWEFGVRQLFPSGYAEVSLYHLKKWDGIYQDSDRQYLNGLTTLHRGIELDFRYRFNAKWQFSTNASYAIHTYLNNPTSGIAIKGNDLDTAPRWLMTSTLNWNIAEHLSIAVAGHYLDDYFMDAANTERYEGHTLFHLRARWQLKDNMNVALNIQNLFDRRYAERADYAFGNHRYFVGRLRHGLISLEWQL
jgi:outer membrane receptor protein involved in Fe transport